MTNKAFVGARSPFSLPSVELARRHREEEAAERIATREAFARSECVCVALTLLLAAVAGGIGLWYVN